MTDVIYFELNNWFSGEDYPEEPPFTTWVEEGYLCDEVWCRSNQLCVVAYLYDMSHNWLITAPRQWVEKNCPRLLSTDIYKYDINRRAYNKETHQWENKTIIESRKYSDFIHTEEDPCGRAEVPFLPYTSENIGLHWININEEENNE